MRLKSRNIILNALYGSFVNYASPSTITYYWNFGVFSLFFLVVQIVTGIVLSMYYTPHIDLAFDSVEHIMRDVNYGWLLRYVHSNGASFFFIVVYIHIFRSFYYGSYMYPRELLWCSGVLILILLIVTAFLGYVLPWGQMSFWAATVITNVVSVIPVIGGKIVIWLWGGYQVANPTLNKFFSLHFLLPFVVLALAIIHIILLHEVGSNNPLGVSFKVDQLPMNPYFILKDLYGIFIILIPFSIFVFFYPNVLSHPDNYIPANSLVTPEHIVPEWYLLPFYALLRSVPNKLQGVIVLALALVSLFFIPFMKFTRYSIRSAQFRPLYRIFFWFFIADCVLLAWIGAKPIEYPYFEIGQYATVAYFVFIFLVVPFIAVLDNIYLFGFPWNRPKLDPNFSADFLNDNAKKKSVLRIVYYSRQFFAKLKSKFVKK